MYGLPRHIPVQCKQAALQDSANDMSVLSMVFLLQTWTAGKQIILILVLHPDKAMYQQLSRSSTHQRALVKRQSQVQACLLMLFGLLHYSSSEGA